MTTQTVTQAVEKRQAGPVTIMWSRRTHFRAVLPASVDVEAFLGTAAGALYASDVPGKKLTLMGCAQASPDSLIVALMECAALGHLPGTDEYYLTPRLDHGRPKVLGIEGYRGVIERMYRSGAVAKVVVREVCAGDYFDYVEGEMDRPIHKTAANEERTGAGFFGASGSRNRGPMVGAYAYAEMTGGATSRVVLLTRDDIFAARDSGGYKPDDQYSPWNRMDGGKDHPEFQGRSMWWKTAAKRLEPWVPTSAEYRREQLRASAAAADLAGMRSRVPELPAGNGHTPEDIHDAEIVEPPGAPAQTAPASAPAAAATPERPRRPGKTTAAGLDRLLRQIPLADDTQGFLTWRQQLGPEALDTVIYLQHKLDQAKGDGDAAADAIREDWQASLAMHAQGATEGGDGDE